MGLGYWGKNILRNLHELGVLGAAYDSDPDTAAQWRNVYPGVKFVSSMDDLLGDGGLQAVAVATPAATHYSIVKKAIEAGKDVFVEKPLALTASQGAELVEIARRKKRVLMVGHVLQYHPAVLRLKQMISEGELGRIDYIYSNRLNIGKPRTEENILWSFAPHDISVILMLTGQEPSRVSAFGGDYLNAGIADTTLTTLEFASGVKGHIFVSWLHPFKEQKLVVVGSKAMAVFDDVSSEKLFLYRHEIEWRQGKMPVAKKAEPRVVPVDKKEPLKEELAYFVKCVKTRERPRTDGEEAVRVLRVLQLAEESLAGIMSGGDALSRQKGFFAHETACIDDAVKIGTGTKIWHYSHILRNSEIGENCVIGQNVSIGPGVKIGSGCKVQNNVSLYKGVTLEDDVFCAPSCVFTNVYNPRAFIERKHEFRPTLVKKGATIGANATIVCGVTIGEYAFIGAGSVVNRDVEPHTLVAGVPARRIGWVCRCGTSLKGIKKEGACPACGEKYRVGPRGLQPLKGKTIK